MAIDSDGSISLPNVPPPRPAARRTAIEAALRKFDGIDEPTTARTSAGRPTRFGWASIYQRPVGALVTAAVVAAISIPVALVTLRDLPQAEAPPPMPPAPVQPAQSDRSDRSDQVAAASEALQDAGNVAAAEPPAPAGIAAPAPPARRNAMSLREEERKAVAEAPAPLAGAPPPPPPPPPPAAAPQYSAESDAASIIVSGSRIQAPAAKQTHREAGSNRAAELASEENSAQFLSRLQSALWSNDRQGLKGLIGFPLIVRIDGRVEVYRSWREVERDFDEIFTPRVRRSVLDLQPDEIVGRSTSGTMGNAMLRFGPSCANRACSKAGPIRIREVNP